MEQVNSSSGAPEIDRSKACPHLLRLFWRSNRNNSQIEYKSVADGKFPQNEIQIYTWPDATLREICDLLKSTVALARQRHVNMSFDLVYPDRNGVHVIRHVSISHAKSLISLYLLLDLFRLSVNNRHGPLNLGGKSVLITAWSR